ncbi:MAG TPA: secondary thiamine-phosphate synthase enzyme YjbQ [bacterium]|nr:secondary thiamine-phosphate synthase enzyme YjbQ [bacterium]
MAVATYKFEVSTQGYSDIIDVSDQVQDLVKRSGLKEGLATVFVPGATAGVTTIEYEAGLVSDLKAALEKLAPQGASYAHDSRWGDGNGFSHIRAALLKASLTVPFSKGRLTTGTWQQIVIVDCDNRARRRQIIVQLTGE